MATQRHEIFLRVLKNISRVSALFELFYDFILKTFELVTLSFSQFGAQRN